MGGTVGELCENCSELSRHRARIAALWGLWVNFGKHWGTVGELWGNFEEHGGNCWGAVVELGGTVEHACVHIHIHVHIVRIYNEYLGVQL